MREGAVLGQRLDLAQPALTGEPVTLADGVATDHRWRSGVSAVAGLVAYRAGVGSQRQLTWVDRSGTVRGTFGDPDGNALRHPRVSPDGRRVVVTRTVQGNIDLWLLDGTRASRLTFDAARDDFQVLSPDGTVVVFLSVRTSPGDLYKKLVGRADAEELLMASDHVKVPTGWSADGRFLMYHSIDPQTNGDLWVLPMQRILRRGCF